MTDSKIAIILVNYNMPERADRITNHIMNTVKAPYEMILVDNGSDIVEPALNSTLLLGKNVQSGNGYIMGLAYADAIAAWEQFEIFAYWFLTTSLEFVQEETDILAILLKPMIEDPEVVFVVPTLTPETNTAWEHQKNTGKSGTRKTWGTDFFLGGLVRAEWLHEANRFNPDLRFGWGICSEINWMARWQKRHILLHEDVIIHKDTDIGYELNRMNMTAEERRNKSAEEMNRVLNAKWGEGALDKLGHEFRTPEEY